MYPKLRSCCRYLMCQSINLNEVLGSGECERLPSYVFKPVLAFEGQLHELAQRKLLQYQQHPGASLSSAAGSAQVRDIPCYYLNTERRRLQAVLSTHLLSAAYHLTSVISHRGRNVRSGHYEADVWDMNDDKQVQFRLLVHTLRIVSPAQFRETTTTKARGRRTPTRR